jgi:uncharacterized membrane-anchored protein
VTRIRSVFRAPALCLVVLAGAPLAAQGEATSEAVAPQLELGWQKGPASGDLGGLATVEVPEGYAFLGPEDTKKILEAMGNLTDGSEKGSLFPADDDWFLVFEFQDVGYVKDDEKDDLDADALLESIREGSERGNEERARRGLAKMTVTGWALAPQYDPATHNLEWAVRFAVENEAPVVNQNTRILGRRGVMAATLVADPEELASVQPKADALLAGFDFASGQRYAEFTKGDKVAQYGLAGLVLGGAAAAAIKTGFFKKFWKLLVVGVAAAASFLRRLFGRAKAAPPAASAEPPAAG